VLDGGKATRSKHQTKERYFGREISLLFFALPQARVLKTNNPLCFEAHK
jgi:hypothetical protein